jgi:hypothetical protein
LIEDELCLYREHGGAATSNFLRISNVCAECLRRNIPRFQGELKAILTDSLYQQLLVLARLRFKHHQDNWTQPLIEAMRISPLSLGAYKRFFRLTYSRPPGN